MLCIIFFLVASSCSFGISDSFNPCANRFFCISLFTSDSYTFTFLSGDSKRTFPDGFVSPHANASVHIIVIIPNLILFFISSSIFYLYAYILSYFSYFSNRFLYIFAFHYTLPNIHIFIILHLIAYLF